MKAKGAEQTLDLSLSVRWPNADMVAMLVGDTGVLSVEFDVDAVPVSTLLKEFASDGDGGRVGVLGIVNALRPGESAGGELAYSGCQLSYIEFHGTSWTHRGKPSPVGGPRLR